jgi:hypothetical protein
MDSSVINGGTCPFFFEEKNTRFDKGASWDEHYLPHTNNNTCF